MQSPSLSEYSGNQRFHTSSYGIALQRVLVGMQLFDMYGRNTVLRHALVRTVLFIKGNRNINNATKSWS